MPQGLQEKVTGRLRFGRNLQFDLLRILFATLVLLSHAPEVIDGNRSREPLHRLTGAPITFGMLAVDGFFVLSGYLIVQSWLADPDFLNFLRKRFLRIVPGYLVAVALSTVAVGLLAPGVGQFFRHLNRHFLTSIVLLTSPVTPPVFPGQWYSVVNGALYTIAYEFRCYLLVALLGLCGLLRRPLLVLIATLVFLSSLLCMEPFERMHWPLRVEMLVGQPALVFQLTAAYLVGVCFHLFRGRFAFRPLFAVAAVALFAAVIAFAPGRAQLALVLCGSYLTFYFGQTRLPWLSAMNKVPDISYGVYLYGSPVLCLWVWFHKGSPWVTFLGSALICFGLGWLSWHFIERPALTLKRRPSATLPSP